jgi:hypothetical protein
VKIQVEDVNDNSPHFVYPASSKRFKKNKYFGGIARDKKEVGTTILQVKVNTLNLATNDVLHHITNCVNLTILMCFPG